MASNNYPVFVFLVALAVKSPYMTSFQEDCGKFTRAYRDQLKTWIGGGVNSFELLYSATRDGCTPAAFQSKADDKGPTVTILYQQDDAVFGGYTSLNWTTNGYRYDNKSFLFVMKVGGVDKSLFLNSTGNHDEYAVFSDSNSGPAFGGNHDLLTFYATNCTKVGSEFQTNGYMHPGLTYNDKGLTKSQFENADQKFTFTNLEVYKVSTDPNAVACTSASTGTSSGGTETTTVATSTGSGGDGTGTGSTGTITGTGGTATVCQPSSSGSTTGKLTQAYKNQLSTWIGDGVNSFKLLYSATRDGCTPAAFQSKADDKGPTVTILYQHNDAVFGGYTSLNWTTSGYRYDNKSFLFVLKLAGVDKNLLLNSTGMHDEYAVYSDSNSGPTFGGNHDLLTFYATNCTKVGTDFQTNGYMHPGLTYNDKGLTKSQFENADQKFTFTNLEVYQVSRDPNAEECQATNGTGTAGTSSTGSGSNITGTGTAINITRTYDGLRCFACLDTEHLRYCDTLARCQKNEVCYVQRRQNKGGQVHYSSGCTSKQTCTTSGADQSNGKCFDCCTDDYCNKNGCGETGFSPLNQRGPLCLDCQHFSNPQECDQISLCAKDESCSIEGYRWGGTEMIYNMGCSSKQNCLRSVGKRSRPVCHGCCEADFCNMNCTTSAMSGPPDVLGV